MMNYKLVLALCKTVIEASFKAVRKKFLDQGADEGAVKKALEDFKKMRDENKIPAAEHKDINFWGKKSWDEFAAFVDNLSKGKLQNYEHAHQKEDVDGAVLASENEDWLLYKIETFEASQELGTDAWCIVRNEDHWDDYTSSNDFYYLLSRNRHKNDRWYKIAVQVDVGGNRIYWDSLDEDHRQPQMDQELLSTFPDYEYPPKQITVRIDGTRYSLDQLEDAGFPESASTAEFQGTMLDVGEMGVLPEHNFFVVEEFQDLDAFADAYSGSLRQSLDDESNNDLVYIESGDSYWLREMGRLESVLDLLEKKDKNTYDLLYANLTARPELGEGYEAGEDGRFNNETLASFMEDEQPDVYNDFEHIVRQCMENAASKQFWKEVRRYIDNNPYVLLSKKDMLWDKIYVGFHLNDASSLISENLDFTQIYKDSDDTLFDVSDLSDVVYDFDENDVVEQIMDYGLDSL